MSSWKIILSDSFPHRWLLWDVWEFCSSVDPESYNNIAGDSLPLPLSIWRYTHQSHSAEFVSHLLSTMLIRKHAGSLSHVTAILQQGSINGSLALNFERQGNLHTNIVDSTSRAIGWYKTDTNLCLIRLSYKARICLSW